MSTATIRRSFADLVEHLFRGQPFPEGAVLATGTGIVPDLDFTLQHDDVVRISIDEVGELTNPVGSDHGWLVEALRSGR